MINQDEEWKRLTISSNSCPPPPPPTPESRSLLAEGWVTRIGYKSSNFLAGNSLIQPAETHCLRVREGGWTHNDVTIYYFTIRAAVAINLRFDDLAREGGGWGSGMRSWVGVFVCCGFLPRMFRGSIKQETRDGRSEKEKGEKISAGNWYPLVLSFLGKFKEGRPFVTRWNCVWQ